MNRTLQTPVLGGLIAVLFASVAMAEISPEEREFFEAKIRPILADNCYSCHSNEGSKLKGGLFLDSKWGWETGGDSGPAILPGNLEDSLLIDAVRRTEGIVDAMPPKSKLSDSEIADLEKWVLMGAPDPRPKVESGDQSLVEVFDLEKRFEEHWSWRPVAKPELPDVRDASWPENGIDHFILAEIEAAGLRPALPAADRTWLRRVYFDLIGLPPTPEQIQAFLELPEATRKAAVVDELLASPHFGEKWARHWMDLVRYAETCGHEFDYLIPYAHEYRDYLIRAWNADLPYDEFIREHVAGDLLPEPRRHPEEAFNESVIATGFWYFHDATHAPTDVLQNEADHQDNQIDVLGKAFQGLTISCARCHDHKFDAISTADYYALAGYLQGSARTEYPLDPGRVREETVQKQRELQAKAAPLLKSPSEEFEPGPYFLAAAKLVRERAAGPSPDPWGGIVFEDFESGYDGWEVSGEAMGDRPASGTFPGQQAVTGFRGNGLVNSWNGSDNLLGNLTSKPFVLEKPFINFLIGGGKHRETRIELEVDGRVVLRASGKNQELLEPAAWDVTTWLGKTARIRIVDQQQGGWGHINVDHIVFSEHPADRPLRLIPDQAVIAASATQSGLDLDQLHAWCELLTNVEAKPNEPAGFLTQWVANSPPKRVPDWNGYDAAEAVYHSESELMADFSRDALPEGWTTTGLAFQPTGEEPGLRMDPLQPLTIPGTVDSGLLGRKQVGTLRSPSFEIRPGEIQVRLNAENILARVVIDNYHMGVFSGLLFRGTVRDAKHAQTNTEGDFRWLRLDGNLDKYVGHRAYLEFVDDGEGFGVIDEVRFASRSPHQDRPHPLMEVLLRETVPETDDQVAEALNRAWQTRSPAITNWLSRHQLISMTDFHPELTPLLEEGSQLAQTLPPPRFAVAMASGTPEESAIYIRGSHLNRGPEVPNRFLEALGAKQGDRLGLADQIANPRNPLTARVFVNRLWHHLFGRGIVPTTDDFGPQGQLPTHPELLDWLAAELMENGWSAKQMIRAMALSQTYQQGSKSHSTLSTENIALADPENKLLHRMPVRRLQAEAIRDAILTVSGGLDPSQFGPGVPTHRTAFMTGRGARASGPLDGNGRRSVYLSIYRNFLSPFMLTFDMPSPFGPKGRRSNSNVPAQALALMNDPFVSDQAAKWAATDTGTTDRQARISEMVERAHGTEASPVQIEALSAFLDQQATIYGTLDERAWADLGHALFNMKDFVFLR